MNQNDATAVNETLQFLKALARASKYAETQTDALLAEFGLSATRLQTLCHLLKTDEPVSLTQLAIDQAFVKSNATQLVDHLEADQLVKRVHDPKDRRATLLEVTEAGKQCHGEAMQALQPLVELLHTLYTLEERAQLLTLLERLNG